MEKNCQKMSSLLGFDKIAELLIQRGALVNVEGHNQMTALMWAAKKGEKIHIIDLKKFR